MTKENSVGPLLLEIFNRLLAHYGPQGWWPGDRPWEMMVGAILTQNTAWSNVEKALKNLKGVGALAPRALRSLSPEELAQLLYPSGYYRVKAQRLKALACLVEEYQDELDTLCSLDVVELRQRLLSVPGVGPETADSIILYAAGKPLFVIDAYTRRIVGCLGLKDDDGSYGEYQALFMQNLPRDPNLYNEYHALLVRHGKETCRKQPLCSVCPLLELCPTGHRGPEAPSKPIAQTGRASRLVG